MEISPDAYIQKLVEVFHEVKRVLKNDGTLWLNLGDSYWSDTLSRTSTVESMWGNRPASDLSKGRDNIPKHNRRGGIGKRPDNMKPKDLLGIPWRVAFALQQDGWYLRQDIIWNKPNPMPERVLDRCTKSHEYIFLLSKSSQYFFDANAIKEPLAQSSIGRAKRKIKFMSKNGVGTLGKQIQNGEVNADHAYAGLAMGRNGKIGYNLESGCRNKRSVWTVNKHPYKGAHFATFPTSLITPCVLAGCPRDGIVLDPFGGSGTTGLVASQNNRNYILIELNPEYIQLQEKRIQEGK